MAVTDKVFGKLSDGTQIKVFCIENDNNMKVSVINYGAAISKIEVPDGNAGYVDVVLGYDDLQGYINDSAYLGATVGRYANRIANGTFFIDGKQFSFVKNNGNNTLHGGTEGFNKKVWQAEIFEKSNSVTMNYTSKDGEEGFPGNLNVHVTFELTHQNEIKIIYLAKTDANTHLNLTNHSYFNLNGIESDVQDHIIKVYTNQYTPFDENNIPEGKISMVDGTVLDLTGYTRIGDRLPDLGNGFDHNYMLEPDGKLKLAAEVKEPASGRKMEMYTTEPGFQFYTGNFLGSINGKQGKIYNNHAGLCIEAQHAPDAPNQPQFQTTLLKPGQEYRQTTIYKFSW